MAELGPVIIHINCRCVLVPFIEEVALPDFIEEFIQSLLEKDKEQ